MPLDNTNMAAALTTTPDVSKFNRLLITYQRVTKRAPSQTDENGTVTHGKPIAWVSESVNLVHPDDAGRGKGTNGFRELGMMFKGNPDYINVVYKKYEAVV